MEIKEKVLESCNTEWQTCGAIAKKTELYPAAVNPILSELLAENKIEKMLFHKRTKYRKPTQIAPFNACPSLTNAPGQEIIDDSHPNQLNVPVTGTNKE